MTVNEAIERLTGLQKNGYGELEIESNMIKIDGADAICTPKEFIKPTDNYNYVVTMTLEEKYIVSRLLPNGRQRIHPVRAGIRRLGR